MKILDSHIDDISGCGMHGVLDCARKFLQKRFGVLKLQESDFVHVGMELSQGSDFSVSLTQSAFTENLLPMDTSPSLWADRQKPLSIDLLFQPKIDDAVTQHRKTLPT